MRFNYGFVVFLGMILLAVVPGFCQHLPVGLPSTRNSQSRALDDPQQTFDRLKLQLGVSDARFAELQPKIMRVMRVDNEFGAGTYPAISSRSSLWDVTSSLTTLQQALFLLVENLEDPHATDDQINQLHQAYERVLAQSDIELIAAQHDLDSSVTSRERGWLLVDGLIVGSPSRGSGEFSPAGNPDALDRYIEGLHMELAFDEPKWNVIRPIILRVIGNQLHSIGGRPVFFPKLFGRITTGPTAVYSLHPSPFQTAISELQLTMANPNSSDADISVKVDAALKVKAEYDAAYATAQKDLRVAGLSPRQEAVLVVYGLLSVHHR